MQVVYQDKNFLVVEKPCGVVVHPDKHHPQGTMLDLLKDKLTFTKYDLNQGIIHRLDKVVSGLMLIARNLKTWNYFKEEMKKQNIIRKYYALVKGRTEWNQLKVNVPLTKPGKHQKVQATILGKEAVTYFKVMKRWKDKTLIECKLETGRTHQIRAHLKFLGHPILNDPLYHQGKTDCIFLYSYFLIFYEPEKKEKRKIQMPIPKFFNLNE